MQGDLLLVALILVFGVAAFLFGLVYVVWCIVGAVGRGMWSLVRPWRPVGTAARVVWKTSRRRAHRILSFAAEPLCFFEGSSGPADRRRRVGRPREPIGR